jgi:diketogulonate reductase-like aldo/keto reductase
MLMMGGSNISGWFELAGKGAAIQTFLGYGNGQVLAPQIAAFGRANVFVSTGIPCGGVDNPHPPMNASAATALIDQELAELHTSYVDLLLVHHRCQTQGDMEQVWSAMEAAKRAGKAKHLGVSNFNSHDLATLMATATEPIEANEARFGVGAMDYEALDHMGHHGIIPIAYSSLAEGTSHPKVVSIAAAHAVSPEQVMFAYVSQHNISVLSTFNPGHLEWMREDLAIFGVLLTDAEISSLDSIQTGVRTCPDCWTLECEACAAKLQRLGCDVGTTKVPPKVAGKGNPNAAGCIACAGRGAHKAEAMAACGDESRGETLETMVAKACGA